MIKQKVFYFIFFLNDENYTQIVSPGKKKAAFAVLIFEYTQSKKA